MLLPAIDAPIVVMVHGSGPLDRDETVYGNKPFRDIAEGLARHGIGTLRYDKRTFAYPQPVTSLDEETILDALAAITLAHNYSGRVYLLGHSLGAMLAPVIAERASGEVEGIIMLAAPARDLETVVREQFDYLLPSGASPDFKEQQLNALRNRAPHYFAPQGQVEAAQRLDIPILILHGERDYQVSMTDFRLWRQSLADRSEVALMSFPTLNHLFIAGEGKSSPIEYQKQGKVDDEVIQVIADFVNAR